MAKIHKENHILGLEINEFSIKIIQKDDLSNLINIIHVESIDKDRIEEDGYISKILKDILKRYKKLINTKNVIVSIPSYMAFTKRMFLEDFDNHAEMLEQIDWEFKQQAVGKPDEYMYDFVQISENIEQGNVNNNNQDNLQQEEMQNEDINTEDSFDDIESIEEENNEIQKENPDNSDSDTKGQNITDSLKEYLVVGIEKNKLEFILKAVRKAKLNPVIFELDVFSMINCFNHNYPEDVNDPVAIIELNHDYVTFCITKDGEYLDSASIFDFDPKKEDKLKKIINSLIIKIDDALKHLKLEQLKKIMLCGTNSIDDRIKDLIISSFSNPVEVMEPFRKFNITEDISKNIEKARPFLAVASGLILRNPEEIIDDKD